jgi:anti-sigma factor RsiW
MTDNFDGELSGAVLDERFELLSAYLDGEVTASERQQVEAWLASDSTFQQQYRQMQQLHQAIPSITVPIGQSARTLANDVFAKIDRRRNRRLAWFGGGALVATLIAAIAGTLGLSGNNSQFQFATHNNNADKPAPLMVALNDPILSMPTKTDRVIEVPMPEPEINID